MYFWNEMQMKLPEITKLFAFKTVERSFGTKWRSNTPFLAEGPYGLHMCQISSKSDNLARGSLLWGSAWVSPILGVKYIGVATWQNQQNECAPSEDSDQPGHPPSLTRIFAVRVKKAWIVSYPFAQRRLWSDWADVQADLILRLAHMPLCWFCHDAAQL